MAFASCLYAAGSPSANSSKPNIVLILADDLGYSNLGCYGGEIKTPNLDSLAANGLRFTQFYNGARCCPSRASLLTGLYPHQAGVGLMVTDHGRPGYRGSLLPNAVTIAEVLKPAGYRTYMVGKWHLTRLRPVEARVLPISRGFDEYYGMLEGFGSFWDPKGFTRLPNGRTVRTYGDGSFYATDALTDYAVDFIDDAHHNTGGVPFFLYLAYTAPHFPLHAAKEDIAKYTEVYTEGWDRIRDRRYERMKKLRLLGSGWPLSPRSEYRSPGPRWPMAPKSDYRARAAVDTRAINPAWDSLDRDRRADLVQRMSIYAAMVDRMDQNIGRLIAHLRKLGQLDNTLVLFLSDNGACAEWHPFGFDGVTQEVVSPRKGADIAKMGDRESYHSYGSGWANACNTPFRLYKHYAHEGGISTPLIVHWPVRIKSKGEYRHQTGHIIDIMATCIDVAGAKYPTVWNTNEITPMEGKSLVPSFQNKPIARGILAWEHEGNRAIRAGKWKLVAESDSEWQLYDVEADRVELNDLAPKRPNLARKLARQWEIWAKRTNVIPRP